MPPRPGLFSLKKPGISIRNFTQFPGVQLCICDFLLILQEHNSGHALAFSLNLMQVFHTASEKVHFRPKTYDPSWLCSFSLVFAVCCLKMGKKCCFFLHVTTPKKVGRICNYKDPTDQKSKSPKNQFWRVSNAALASRVAQEPNRNQKPEPSEPFSQEPNAEPEPPEPFSRNRNRNWNRPLCETALKHTKTPSLEEPPEPESGTARIILSPIRNRSEPGPPCKSRFFLNAELDISEKYSRWGAA